ncbi:hypothetical protein HGRIS_003796 [Hohenbuehelia grisea]|uniref:Uncharacterized protein n=1 Tax=Hohenbuehelia grisea TaxID=104357 RepID=A0ABR3JGK8_9AGAR
MSTMEDEQRTLADETQQVLQDALSDAFSLPPPTPQAVTADQPPAPAPPAESPSLSPDAPSLESSTVDVDSWKSEYDEQVQTWRTQSAEAREKAEQERARWEAIRAAEGGRPPFESPSHLQPAAPTLSESPSPADARDLVTGEQPAQPIPGPQGSHLAPPSTHSQPETIDESQKWEDIPSSLTSSFPSMSFPEHTEPSSPARKPKPDQPQADPPSATLTVFDTSLSTRTRVKALVSALAINLLLPFVNGVMLGFGEIFAKNVVLEWFGWNQPARTGRLAAMKGLSSSNRFRRGSDDSKS